MSATKKLVNESDVVVDDCLEGLCYTHAGLKLIRGHRVVVRSDYPDVIKRGKVAIMSGGGSGHEPAHAGYVGPGIYIYRLSLLISVFFTCHCKSGSILT